MAALTQLKSSLLWQTPKGRDLIRLDESGRCASVIIGCADEAELRALAKAATEAAEQIAALKVDAA